MLQTIWQIAWRAGLILLLIVGVWQFLKYAPLIQADQALKKSKETIAPLLETGKLAVWLDLTKWNEIKVRDRGSIDAYYNEGTQALEYATTKLTVTKDRIEDSFWPSNNPAFFKRISNEILLTNNLLRDSVNLYQELQDLFNYYSGSTLAIYNLIYYDPKFDLAIYRSSGDPEALLQRFGAARDGLEKTKTRLMDLPDYQNDDLKDFLLPQLLGLITEADFISSNALSDPNGSVQRAVTFDQTVQTIQVKLVKNRQSFWNEKPLKDLNQRLNSSTKEFLNLFNKLSNRQIELEDFRKKY